MEKELINYIKESKEKGFSDDDIRKALRDAGWEEKDIDEGFKSISEPSVLEPLASPEPPKIEETFRPEKEIKKAKPPTTLISMVFLIAGVGHLASIPILSLFGLVSWSFAMMAIFSIISAILLFATCIALWRRKSWYLKPFLMLFGLVIVIGLVLFFTRGNPIFVIEILFLVFVYWVFWKHKEKFGYQVPPQFFKRWSFLVIGIIIGLILGGVILAEAYHWITPKYEKIKEEIEEEIEKEKEVAEIVPEKWTTYKNEEYAYQIDYPTDWVLYSHAPFYVAFQTFSKEELGGKECAIQKDCLSVIIEVDGSEFSSLEEWINKWRGDFEKAIEQGLNWEVKEGEISVEGKKGYEFIAWIPKSSIVPASHRVGLFERGKLYYIKAEGLEQTLLEKFPKTFKHMISSFKFAE